ncbi:hypothetical protein PR202_ga22932 [Eleusine coracana subsp. coracana]|uniref:MADS-box domain-containing protein n=1 Tax=Eleusine coracana subsp. coracana TaxID=191504 RepID=A0AAV5D4J3_ELECO|nr:hypothetical protein QOZ80_1AG0016060 [Eleusine coracana subsp. coracana]GJN05313.1 hypothetical protein PR202_ga22932 [Eleusine coracana subsp. coracana]
MGRKKVSLQWIANNASRRATFNRRRQGLIKKTSELATLCGVKVCVLVYGEKDVQPEVWPSVQEARDLIASYKATAGLQQWSKKTSHEDFLKKRIAKLQEQVKRSDRESQVRETSILLHEAMAGRRPGLVGVTPEEVLRLREVVERKMKAVQERLQRLGIEPEQQLPHAWPMIQQPQRHQHDLLSSAFAGTSSSSAGPSTASTSSHNRGVWPWN